MSTAEEITKDEMREAFKEFVFNPGQAPGAIENGKRVMKVNSRRGEQLPDGVMGIVLASHCVPMDERAIGDDYVYFVRWDWFSDFPLAVRGTQVEVA